jgi:hypothetical protein
MRFDEMSLYIAVHRVYACVEKPGSDDWISENAKAAYKLVLMQLVEMEGWTDHGIAYSMERMVQVWRDMRKAPKIRLKCEVILAHGGKCFYAGRGVGPCSDEADLDRIVPESRGGRYAIENCVVACTAHNRARGDRAIEEYLGARPAVQ